ncbi:MAG: Fe-S cluster assembly protein SufD [Rhizobacter sp.]|nr:Fe-S cluster assembly protein SufD [Rhizobacter sp.]
MNTVTAIRRPAAGYLETLLEGQPQLKTSPLAWINALRAEAVNRVDVLKLPTLRDEEWRSTDISRLTNLSFSPAQSATFLEATDIAHFFIEEATTRLVFVDGIHAPHLSSTASCSNGDSSVMVSSLQTVPATHAATIEAHLGRHAAFRDNVFAAINTAFVHEAAVIVVPRNVALAGPVHLLFIATQKEVVSTPRCLVVAETGSIVTVIEDYVVSYQPRWQEEPHFTNAVTEIALEDNARVNHIRIQREGAHAFHIANCAVSLGRSSNYQSVSIALGAQISRYNLDVLLAEGAECAVDGLALIAANQLADTHTCIDHAQPHGVSRQLHKCIVGGSAHAVFNGKIKVRQGAQRTDSVQSSRNLLLTGRARVDTKPQLEIFADDVKCAHGATIGQLDGEEVFYLKSRGLSDSVARNLLTYAFGAEIIERIPVASLRHRLEQMVIEQTSSQS